MFSLVRKRRSPLSKALVMATVALSASAAILACESGLAAATTSPKLVSDPTTYVDPKIGNTEAGTTWPGASRPFGMAENSPDTRTNSYTSYDYGDSSILGFSQEHLSGVGCQITGDIKIMPTLGQVTSTAHAATASSFSHTNEVERPGYYSVKLDAHDIQAELTSTERVGYDRFTYPAGTADAKLLINVADGNGTVFDSHLTVVDSTTIQGYATGGNFCGETGSDRYTIYFSTKLSQPMTGYSTWDGRGGTPTAGKADASGGALLSFDGVTSQPLTTMTGISYSSVEGAQRNRLAETAAQHGTKNFDTVVNESHTAWKDELRRVDVASSSTDDLTTFYTALYHGLLHPSLASDVDGTYQGFDHALHNAGPGHSYYQMLSLWDTYRAQNQLVAMLEPQRATDIARSILDIAQQGGWLPRWALGQSETNVMSGDPVTAFIVTLYSRGLLDHTLATQLYAELWKNVNKVPPAAEQARGRDGNPTYVKNGYIGYQNLSGPKFGDTRQAGSATLEYAYSDCALATMAAGLGKTDQANTLRNRCDNVVNEWNPTLTSKGFTGFPQARAADGSWVGDPDPAKSAGFHEGTGWQYQWLVQQDPQTLFRLMGGPASAEQRLDTFFTTPDVLAHPSTAASKDWVIGPYAYTNAFAFNPNNEPDLHTPWMYSWTSSPWKTSAILRAGRQLFTDSPTGMPGNDDLGTISSWLVFGMLGIFEAQPGSGNFEVTAPMFDRSVITPNGGKSTTISSPGGSSTTLQYVAGVKVDGVDQGTRSWLANKDLLAAKKIDIATITNPATATWGSHVADQPPALGTGSSRLITSAGPVTVSAGGAAALTVTAFGTGATTSNAVYELKLPKGITAPLSSGGSAGTGIISGIPSGGTASRTVTLHAGAGVAPGTYQVSVTATADNTGLRSAPALATITVTAAAPAA
ncbi:MAG: alpha,2-mannosidase [Amycolatopsis sp.]|uniref:GH92 family glycosyl hydrolase n=1 Tax=Amycolatopsis sp. TaxID=37632 RepID=UPI00261DBAA8|nr:GH92 family glycosyl hydrolase [Amycolatopsis sp.]MCU1681489.1 alpha,2-mannosidase [Amycolatopsis sp.]